MNEPCWTQTIMFAPFLPRQQPKHLKRQGGSDFPDQTFTPHVLRDFSFAANIRVNDFFMMFNFSSR